MKVVCGNWKMFKTQPEAKAWARSFTEAPLPATGDVKVRIYASFTSIATLADALGKSGVSVGGQNLHPADDGAFTGEVSARMLLDAGAESVLVGHSERRHVFGETDEFLADKVRSALNAGLHTVFCVGETLDEREAGTTHEVLTRQVERGLARLSAADLDRVELAYEPVWAIGTGKVAEVEQVRDAHQFLHEQLRTRYGRTVPVLYGGSVKPSNALEILSTPGVDGVLVGGASLQPGDFLEVVRAAEKTA